MATFGKNVEIFQQIADGNLQVLRDLVASTTHLVQQPMPSLGSPDLGKLLQPQDSADAASTANGKAL